jgi:hypothetical protein
MSRKVSDIPSSWCDERELFAGFFAYPQLTGLNIPDPPLVCVAEILFYRVIFRVELNSYIYTQFSLCSIFISETSIFHAINTAQ